MVSYITTRSYERTSIRCEAVASASGGLHCCKAGVRSGGATCYESDTSTTSSELHACYRLQGDRGHKRSHMRKAGKSRWSHMLQGDTIAGGEIHYCGAGASKAVSYCCRL